MDSVSGPWKGHFQLLFVCAAVCVRGWGCVWQTDSVAVRCLCITAAQCSLSGKWHSFFFRLCFVPIHQCRPIFCHTECKYWTSFQSDVLYSLEEWHKGNHTLTAVWLFIQTAPFIQQEPGWGRPAWSVSRATLILLSAWATNDKATVWLITSNVTVHTYLSFRSLAKGACNLE